ncbi:leukocyte elastase inhibitor C-like isoform X1 [Leptidea sinapis]|uniref:leukocyte elastase inhibitor C-like isoform X1 n=1 Tax=Leptidea sinapis TaxID=189913 RepID=UPI0021C29E82|nr:leukocyte elastase inhibitor C-like isoform X1 [Leptidea sinapis]
MIAYRSSMTRFECPSCYLLLHTIVVVLSYSVPINLLAPMTEKYTLPSKMITYCWLNNKWGSCPESKPRSLYSGAAKTTSLIGNLQNTNFATVPTFGYLSKYNNFPKPFHYASKITQLGNSREGFRTNNEDRTHSLALINKSRPGLAINLSLNENVQNNKNLTGLNLPSSYNIHKFLHTLDHLERVFYSTTFAKLSSISPPDRRQNGISFVLSGLFLQIALIAISTEVDPATRKEIDKTSGFHVSDQIKTKALSTITSWLPGTSKDFTFRWAMRIVLPRGLELSDEFTRGPASALRLKVNHIDVNETTEAIMQKLNHMIEVDSGGAMRDTFDEEDLSNGICAVLMTSMYVRPRWRASPTLLNDSYPFRDADGAPNRTTRMIRINDIMRYADLTEWDAEALEINYSTPGLTFFMLIPRGRSLRSIAAHMSVTNIKHISDRMRTVRVAAALPLYTLRMTLLLPGKLKSMGISRLLYNTTCDGLKLSHGVQRIMFWSEAGRYAYKDDGIEWDDPPVLNITIDRPYMFFVQWQNITILNGNFVL